MKTLEQAIEDETASLPLLVTELARLYLEQIGHLSKKIAALTGRSWNAGRVRRPANGKVERIGPIRIRKCKVKQRAESSPK